MLTEISNSLKLLVKMICANEAEFRYHTKWQDAAPWVTPFRHFVLALTLLCGKRSQILRDPSNKLLNTHRMFIDLQCNNGYSGSCERSYMKYWKMIHSCTFYYASLIFDIANYIFRPWHYSESCIKVTLLVCGWCQAISSKSKCQIRLFPLCFQNIPYFLPVV